LTEVLPPSAEVDAVLHQLVPDPPPRPPTRSGANPQGRGTDAELQGNRDYHTQLITRTPHALATAQAVVEHSRAFRAQ